MKNFPGFFGGFWAKSEPAPALARGSEPDLALARGNGIQFLHFREFSCFFRICGNPARPWFGPSQTPQNRPGNRGPGKSKISQFWAQGRRSEPRRFRRRRSRWDGRKISWVGFPRLHERARFRSRFPEKGVKNTPFHPIRETLWYRVALSGGVPALQPL